MVEGKEEWSDDDILMSTFIAHDSINVNALCIGGGGIESDENLKKERHGAKSFSKQDGFQTSAECRQGICFLFGSD